MLDFFRDIGSTIPQTSRDADLQDVEMNAALSANPINVLQEKDRAAIIVLREDLDFYVIPPEADISPSAYMAVKRACGRKMLQQNGIFSGLKTSNEAGTTEQHLIEMLTAGCVPLYQRYLFCFVLNICQNRFGTSRVLTYISSGFNVDDTWGHRASEPNKAVICSLALARLRNLKTENGEVSPVASMAQKLILFWRKPAVSTRAYIASRNLGEQGFRDS